MVVKAMEHKSNLKPVNQTTIIKKQNNKNELHMVELNGSKSNGTQIEFEAKNIERNHINTKKQKGDLPSLLEGKPIKRQHKLKQKSKPIGLLKNYKSKTHKTKKN
uniref:Uncharacterized protein n=1 Tax=Bactrocera dorsalis TaxID=27457 RepID=A0A034WML2_BACDO